MQLAAGSEEAVLLTPGCGGVVSVSRSDRRRLLKEWSRQQARSIAQGQETLELPEAELLVGWTGDE
jgi:hypothetical protein